MSFQILVLFFSLFDQRKYLPKNWSGTALDILKIEDCPRGIRLKTVLHENWIEPQGLRLFMCKCVELIFEFVEKPELENAIKVVYQYMKGDATLQELSVVSKIAYQAVNDASNATDNPPGTMDINCIVADATSMAVDHAEEQGIMPFGVDDVLGFATKQYGLCNVY